MKKISTGNLGNEITFCFQNYRLRFPKETIGRNPWWIAVGEFQVGNEVGLPRGGKEKEMEVKVNGKTLLEKGTPAHLLLMELVEFFEKNTSIPLEVRKGISITEIPLEFRKRGVPVSGMLTGARCFEVVFPYFSFWARFRPKGEKDGKPVFTWLTEERWLAESPPTSDLLNVSALFIEPALMKRAKVHADLWEK